MVRLAENVFRNVLGQFLLCGERSGGFDEPETVGNSENVRVHRHSSLAERHGFHDVGCLSAHARQRCQSLNLARYLAVEVRHELLRHSHKVLGLAVGVAYRRDVAFHFIDSGSAHGLRVGKRLEQCWRDHVHPFVGALSRQHHSHKQLEVIAEVKFAFRFVHVGFEPFDYSFVSFYFFHRLIFVVLTAKIINTLKKRYFIVK